MKNINASADFRHIKYFLLDMDGTFCIGNRPIKGSRQFLQALLSTGRDFLFMTNNSAGNSKSYAKKLSRMAVKVNEEKIFTSGEATGIWIHRQHPGARVFVLGNNYLKADLHSFGLEIVDENPDVVIIGFDTTLTYAKLRKACRFIEKGIPYVATHPDFFCPSENGKLPDCGAITAAIRLTTGIDPHYIIGKPNVEMVDAVLAKLGASADQVVMCGDRIATDMKMAHDAGLLSCLVMCGETDEHLLEQSSLKPNYVFANLSAIIPFL